MMPPLVAWLLRLAQRREVGADAGGVAIVGRGAKPGDVVAIDLIELTPSAPDKLVRVTTSLGHVFTWSVVAPVSRRRADTEGVCKRGGDAQPLRRPRWSRSRAPCLPRCRI